MVRNGKSPLLQYGYGAYGDSIYPQFEEDVLSLLDRGFIYALAQADNRRTTDKQNIDFCVIFVSRQTGPAVSGRPPQYRLRWPNKQAIRGG